MIAVERLAIVTTSVTSHHFPWLAAEESRRIVCQLLGTTCRDNDRYAIPILNMTMYDLQIDAERAAALGIDKAPGIAVLGGT